ncbi:MAG: hypothetical protein IPM02_26365 [Betaproteobacteria bacterium]|nr:hypothetical protein [Betaproteobacteria bacterium]
MNIRSLIPAALWLVAVVAPALASAATSSPPATAPAAPQVARAIAAAAAQTVPFVANRGQWGEAAAFAAPALGGTLFVTREGTLRYALPGKPLADPVADPLHRRGRQAAPATRGPGWVIGESLLDGAGRPMRAAPRGVDRTPESVSFAVGSDGARHASAIPTYATVAFGDVYEGIGMRLRAGTNNVEKIFEVAPRADPGRIRLRVDGTDAIAVGTAGELVVQTGNGPVAFTAPVAYQADARGQRTSVEVAYAVDAAARTYGFALGAYDQSRPLVIDPLLHSTYLGSAASDIAWAVAVHPESGDIYVAGGTSALNSDFPGVIGSGQSVSGGGTDAFVTRFSADLLTRKRSIYFGAGGTENAFAIAIHPGSGDVYIAGSTTSPNSTLPNVGGSVQPVYGGGSNDAFVAFFPADLSAVRKSTYLGTTASDSASAVAIHPLSGDVYVGGNTSAVGTAFPGSASGAQPSSAGMADGFIARLAPSLESGLVSTYFGGSANDGVGSLVIHPLNGDVYAGGDASDGATPIPGVAGGGQAANAGQLDCFVTRLGPNLNAIVQSSYVGDGTYNTCDALAAHPVTGDIYVAGYVGTPIAPALPGLAGGAQSLAGGDSDGFITRLNAGLTSILQSTLIGAAGQEQVHALAVHPATGDVYAVGETSSTASTLPGTGNGAQPAYGGGTDAFVARFNSKLTVLVQSTYLGGSGYDRAWGLAVHPQTSEVIVAGQSAAGFPVSPNATQPDFGGVGDAFVVRHSLDLRGNDPLPDPFAFAPKLNVPPGSLQTSDPAQITGLSGPVPISILGGALAQYCIATSANCGACNVAPFTSAPGTVANNQYVCVRQFAPATVPGVAELKLAAGGGIGQFFVSTGVPLQPCTLDFDGNGAQDALTDGLLVLRALFGLTGNAVTNNAIGDNAKRDNWPALRAHLNGNCGAAFMP